MLKRRRKVFLFVALACIAWIVITTYLAQDNHIHQKDSGNPTISERRKQKVPASPFYEDDDMDEWDNEDLSMKVKSGRDKRRQTTRGERCCFVANYYSVYFQDVPNTCFVLVWLTSLAHSYIGIHRISVILGLLNKKK